MLNHNQVRCLQMIAGTGYTPDEWDAELLRRRGLVTLDESDHCWYLTVRGQDALNLHTGVQS